MDVGMVAQLGSALWNMKVMCDQYANNKREIKELQSFMQDYGEVIPALTQRFKEGGGNALGIGALQNMEKDITEAISKLERWSRNKKFFRVFTSTDRMQKLVNLHSKVMASVQKSLGIANLSMLLNVQATQATLLESNVELKSLLMTSIGSVHGTLPPKVRDEVVEASTLSFADPKFWEDILAAVDTHNGKFPLSEDLSMYEDPITSNLVIDPVVCSDGNTYCRWTIIDNHLTKSPLNMGEDLSIVVDNLSLRRDLFEKFPEQFEVFRQRRKEYRGHALSLFGQGMLGDAILALQYVTQWNKRDVEVAEVLAQAQRALEEAKRDCLHSSFGLSSEECTFSSQLRVIVGLDFGTTHSGFAFAHITDLDKILTFYEYPRAGFAVKTLTASYYKQVNGVWEFRNWGFPARAEYERDIAALKAKRHGHASVGSYFTDFKLRLAGSPSGPSSPRPLPLGLTVDVLITDYLRAMGELILRTLRECYGSPLSRKEIQWCITVPSIWDDAAKATMRTCMAAAGLVNGLEGSQRPLIVVLEPEAASFHCLKGMSEQVLEIGDKLLVADIGGETADVVVQEVVSGQNQSRNSRYRVKEVTISSGGLCGGTHVDMRFMEFLHTKIGPCLEECIIQDPKIYAFFIKFWEDHKRSFGDPSQIGESIDLNLPRKLESEWEKYDVRMGNAERDTYGELEITYEEMQSIFDPVIDRNLELIDHQLQQVGGVKVLIVVGGFAASPYLLNRIKHHFGRQVPQIISPSNPGSTVCQGAVALAVHPPTTKFHIFKKTYGLRAVEPFVPDVDPPELGQFYKGMLMCKSRFDVCVRRGDHVNPNDCISRLFMPVSFGQTTIELELFNSKEKDPRYVVGEGVRREGRFTIDISGDMRLEKERRVNVTLFFGKSNIEVVAKALNFMVGGSSSLKSTPTFE